MTWEIQHLFNAPPLLPLKDYKTAKYIVQTLLPAFGIHLSVVYGLYVLYEQCWFAETLRFVLGILK